MLTFDQWYQKRVEARRYSNSSKTLQVARNLLDRLEKLERRPVLKYAGVWRDGAGYLEGECVTHRGSLWYCSPRSSATPASRRCAAIWRRRGSGSNDAAQL
jgi:hypothetical protein